MELVQTEAYWLMMTLTDLENRPTSDLIARSMVRCFSTFGGKFQPKTDYSAYNFDCC